MVENQPYKILFMFIFHTISNNFLITHGFNGILISTNAIFGIDPCFSQYFHHPNYKSITEKKLDYKKYVKNVLHNKHEQLIVFYLYFHTLTMCLVYIAVLIIKPSLPLLKITQINYWMNFLKSNLVVIKTEKKNYHEFSCLMLGMNGVNKCVLNLPKNMNINY